MGKNLNKAKVDDTVCTPRWILTMALEILGVTRFGLDPACNPQAAIFAQGLVESAVMLPNYRASFPWSPPGVCFQDGLEFDWRTPGPVWLNPPYSRLPYEPWVRKWLGVTEGVCLVPVRTASAWWQDDVVDADVVTCLRKRVVHQGHTDGAPFGQALLYTGPRAEHWASEMLRRNLGWTTTN